MPAPPHPVSAQAARSQPLNVCCRLKTAQFLLLSLPAHPSEETQNDGLDLGVLGFLPHFEISMKDKVQVGGASCSCLSCEIRVKSEDSLTQDPDILNLVYSLLPSLWG